MEQIKLKFIGLGVLITHNNQTANPLNKYAKAMKELTAKRKKTEQDHLNIARLEWEAGLYLEDGMVKLPARVLESTMWNGAKKSKNGIKWQSGCLVDEDFIELDYRGPKIKFEQNGQMPIEALDRYFDNLNHQQIVKVGTAKIVRTRPVFEQWSLTFTVNYDDEVINKSEILDAARNAGKLVGLCEMRPRFGRFDFEVV